MSATRTSDCSRTRACLYLSFELGEGKWTLSSTVGFGRKPRQQDVVARDCVAVEHEIRRAKQRFGLPEDAPVVSCYEAGRDGFWLHRYLLSVGVENLVVDSASIQVDRRRRRELASLVGLVPTPYNSGTQERDQGISKAGNRRIRAMAIEIAWGWLRFQRGSALSRWYERKFAQGSKRRRKIGIVALARKLRVELWKYLQTGVPPRGAKLGDWRTKISYTPALT
jgi:transposase